MYRNARLGKMVKSKMLGTIGTIIKVRQVDNHFVYHVRWLDGGVMFMQDYELEEYIVEPSEILKEIL